MKSTTRILLIFILLVTACDEDANVATTCFVTNPVQELDWLASEIEDIEQSSLEEYFYVAKAFFDGRTVLIIGNCCPYCNSIYPVYDCSGNRIGVVGDENISTDILENSKLVWAPDNSSCAFN